MTLQLSLEDGLAEFLASEPTAIGNPYPLYERLREADANYWHERGSSHFLTTYEEVKTALQNAGPVSQGGYSRGTRARAIEAALAEPDRRLLHEVFAFETLYLSRSDGEQHDRLRRIAHRA